MAAAQVSPSDRAGLEGNAQTIYPLGRARARVMTLHADVPAGTYAGHAYRREAVDARQRLEGWRTTLQVTASNGGRSPASPRTTFLDNHGPTITTLLSATEISFPTTERPAIDPAPQFEFRIPYGQPLAAAGTTLCLDVQVLGNRTSSGNDRNFTPYLDAHEWFTDGRAVQPSFGYGGGCGGSNPSLALTLIHRGASVDLDLDQRGGVPTNSAGDAFTLLAFGFAPADLAFPGSTCRLRTTTDVALLLPGANSATGGWSGRVGSAPPPFAGLVTFAQALSVQPATGTLAFTDGVRLTVPPQAPTVVPTVRIANGTDPDATTGTVASAIPVTQFF